MRDAFQYPIRKSGVIVSLEDALSSKLSLGCQTHLQVHMSSAGLPRYAPVATSSSSAEVHKFGTTPTDEPTSEDLELDLRVYGPDDLAEDTDADGGEGTQGLLSGKEKGAEADDADEAGPGTTPLRNDRSRRRWVRSSSRGGSAQ